MRLTIDAANKLVRTYSVEIGKLNTEENANSTISYLDGEKPMIPEYDFKEHQRKLDRLNGNIEKIKHAVNQFNCSYVIPDIGITIDVALVRMAVLNKRVSELNSMRSLPKISRMSRLRTDKAEYTEPNYSLDEANEAYEAMNNELIAMQSALNLANVTNEIEVELD